MKKITALFFISLLLTACSVNTSIPSVDKSQNQQQREEINKRSQTGSTARYLCKDDKIVRVVQTKLKQKSDKIENITLSFNGMTEKLKSTVSETGKAYTNIHWRWIERADGNASLTNMVGVILADVCIKQN